MQIEQESEIRNQKSGENFGRSIRSGFLIGNLLWTEEKELSKPH
jgi:hypothetical protein